MKKLIVLVLAAALMFCMAACSEKTVAMQDVFNANQMDSLLKNHKSVNIQHTMDGEPYANTYLSHDYVFDGVGD